MRSRLLLTCFALITLCLGAQSVFAARPHQTTSTPTATAGTVTATDTATAVPPTATAVPPTATATATATAAATPTLVPRVRVTAELVSSPPGVIGRFTVFFSSPASGQGRVIFGTSCNGLVETATRDVTAGSTQHVVTVVGNDLPTSAGDNGLQPGVTYYFATVTVTSSGQIVDNNGGTCYSVTIPTAVTTPTAQVLTATLLGASETAGGAPNGRGFATVSINTTTNTLCFSLTVSGVTLPAVAAHIHRGVAGVAGPVVIPLTAPGANGMSSGCVTADAALLSDILANPSNYYVNVHTTEFPAGAMRGQLGTARVLSATMSGSQETPPASPTGSGSATIMVDTSDNSICYTLVVSGITLPAIAAHIHKGAPGVAGPVVVPLTAPDQYGVASGCTTAAASLVQDILVNPSGYYVNVHTTDYPAGAIRGQLRSGNTPSTT